MSSRAVLAGLVAAAILLSVSLAWRGVERVRREREAAALVQKADARLGAGLLEAPALDRLQASTARAALSQALELGVSDDQRTHVEGELDYARAIEALEEGDLPKAETALDSARARLGWTARLRVLAGTLAWRRTDLAEATLHANAALSLAPDDPRALLLSGALALARGEPKAALAALEGLARRVPKSGYVADRLGRAREATGDLEGAEAAYRDAVRLNERDLEAWIDLGRALRAAHQPELSKTAFSTALAAAHTPGEEAQARLGRGLAAMDLGLADAAAADFQRAADLAPNDPAPALALGDLYLRARRIDEALVYYREATDRDGQDPTAWLKLGNALVADAALDDAVRAFDKALALAPDLAAAHNGRGAALMHAGHPDAARKAFERAAALDPTDANPWLNLGLLDEAAHDEAAAREDWRAALARDPGSEVARAKLDAPAAR